MFIEYKLEDGSVAIVEATEDIAAFMSEEYRTTENKDRQYRYYAPYSLDALIYECMDYADTDTPETIYLGYEEEDDDERMEKYLSSQPTRKNRNSLKGVLQNCSSSLTPQRSKG